MAVLRWRFFEEDAPLATREYIFPMNPTSQTSPYRSRAITTQPLLRAGSRPLVFEGGTDAKQWEFSGITVSADHHDALRRWCLKPNPIRVYDHLGFWHKAMLYEFDWQQEAPAKINRYWYGTYTIKAYVLDTNFDGRVPEGGPV